MGPGKANSFAMDNWTTQLRKGLLELCIVNLLAEDELYGYDLVKRLCDIPGLVVTEGTVYPLLSRLRKAALVETRLVESSAGPARRYYCLTAAGQEARALMDQYWNELVQKVGALVETTGTSGKESHHG